MATGLGQITQYLQRDPLTILNHYLGLAGRRALRSTAKYGRNFATGDVESVRAIAEYKHVQILCGAVLPPELLRPVVVKAHAKDFDYKFLNDIDVNSIPPMKNLLESVLFCLKKIGVSPWFNDEDKFNFALTLMERFHQKSEQPIWSLLFSLIKQADDLELNYILRHTFTDIYTPIKFLATISTRLNLSYRLMPLNELAALNHPDSARLVVAGIPHRENSCFRSYQAKDFAISHVKQYCSFVNDLARLDELQAALWDARGTLLKDIFKRKTTRSLRGHSLFDEPCSGTAVRIFQIISDRKRELSGKGIAHKIKTFFN